MGLSIIFYGIMPRIALRQPEHPNICSSFCRAGSLSACHAASSCPLCSFIHIFLFHLSCVNVRSCCTSNHVRPLPFSTIRYHASFFSHCSTSILIILLFNCGFYFCCAECARRLLGLCCFLSSSFPVIALCGNS